MRILAYAENFFLLKRPLSSSGRASPLIMAPQVRRAANLVMSTSSLTKHYQDGHTVQQTHLVSRLKASGSAPNRNQGRRSDHIGTKNSRQSVLS